MSRPHHKLTDDRRAACDALVRGELVVDGEAHAWREDVPRCGTAYLVREPGWTETVARDTPEKAIEDLLDARAPAPKPNELAEALRLERERVWRLFAILFQGRGDVWRGSEFSRALWEGDAEPRKVEPEADELTVDEVLEVLAHVLRDVTRDVWLSSDVAFGNWHLGRDRFRIRGKGGPLEGTIREVLVEAKRRGLLG